eukprot:NODE_6437_length_506_cov_197.707317.p1 GENE.NODE_6437_length_506_cov_197.707317~~NODE_6437_length_506_cov_197.707317.p1  ORF type:complete len:112 (+),score=31.39 NODE_6437_length_506_cov_197.707317:3-338(+)
MGEMMLMRDGRRCNEPCIIFVLYALAQARPEELIRTIPLPLMTHLLQQTRNVEENIAGENSIENLLVTAFRKNGACDKILAPVLQRVREHRPIEPEDEMAYARSLGMTLAE